VHNFEPVKSYGEHVTAIYDEKLRR